MHKRAQIPLSLLHPDLRNPRFDRPAASWKEAFAELARIQKRKLLILARDIARNGLDPSLSFMVLPEDDQYVVLEGNRRLTALKLLSTPGLPESLYTREADLKDLRAAVADALEYGTVSSEVPCVILESRDSATRWLATRHTGLREGAGLDSWDPREQARFSVILGQQSPTLEVYDFVQEYGGLSGERLERMRSMPFTNVQRMLDDKAVQKVLGIEIEGKNGHVFTRLGRDEVIKGLRRLIVDTLENNKEFNSRSMNKAPERLEWVKQYPAADRPSEWAVQGPEPQLLSQAPVTRGPPQPKAQVAAAKPGAAEDVPSPPKRPPGNQSPVARPQSTPALPPPQVLPATGTAPATAIPVGPPSTTPGSEPQATSTTPATGASPPPPVVPLVAPVASPSPPAPSALPVPEVTTPPLLLFATSGGSVPPVPPASVPVPTLAAVPSPTVPISEDVAAPSLIRRDTLFAAALYVTGSEGARINYIYDELTKLSIKKYPNAVSVMFRVFFELSIDHYCRLNRISLVKENAGGTQKPHKKLAEKFEEVCRHLEVSGTPTIVNDLKAVRQMVNNPNTFGWSIDSMHQYVHNLHMVPDGDVLRVAGDQALPFLRLIWPQPKE